MLQDQDMFLKSATTSAVGFAYLNITPIAGDGMTFAWSAFGVPVTSVACGLDYYGSYTGALVFTDDRSPHQHALVHCPGFRGHDFSQEGICTFFAPGNEQVFVKWQCSASPPPPGAIAACDGDAEIITGPADCRMVIARGDFRAVIANRLPDGSLQGYSEFEAIRRLTQSHGFRGV